MRIPLLIPLIAATLLCLLLFPKPHALAADVFQGLPGTELPGKPEAKDVLEAPEEEEDLAGKAAQDPLTVKVEKAETALEMRQRSFAGLFGSWFTDDNDVSVLQGGAFGLVRELPEVDLYAQVMTGRIHQDDSGARPESDVYRTSVQVGLKRLFLTPRIEVWGAFLYEHFDLDQTPGVFTDSFGNVLYTREDLERDYLVGGVLGGAYHFLNGSTLSLEGRRESIWSQHDTYDTRLFNRVSDISEMSADMAINKLKLSADVVTYPEHEWRTDVGVQGYEDGNTRVWAYTHYQIPILQSRYEHWLVLRPNLYVEHLEDEKAAYFSPEHHVTLGAMLHTIQEYEYVDIEAEVNPQLLWTREHGEDADTGAGVHGLLRLIFKPTDNFRFGVGTFGYVDTEEYWLYRVNAFLQIIF
jgi:hypothetical protein